MSKPFASLVLDFTDRVRSTRREVIDSLCLSVHTCGGGGILARSSQGVPPARSSRGGGVPQPGPARGYPTLGTPQSDLARGVPCCGVPHLRSPHQTWSGVPYWGVPHLGYPPIRPTDPLLGGTPSGTPIRPGRGDTLWGYPTSGPPIRPGRGDPCQGGTPPPVTDGVLDTPRSVCLLRSRRRTFLLFCNFEMISASIFTFHPNYIQRILIVSSKESYGEALPQVVTVMGSL